MSLYYFKANHGGVKGRLPAEVINQDPTMSQGDGGGRTETADSDEEEIRPSTPDQEELNQSDDGDDAVCESN